MTSAIRRTKPRVPLTGFTFIEILIVVTVIGILTGISLPRLKKTFDNLQLNGFSRELQSTINYLYQRSVVGGKAITLTVDNDKREIRSEIQADGGQAIGKTYPIPQGLVVSIEVDPSQGDGNQIRFTPDGLISKANIVVTGTGNESIVLTTKGVFGGVKILPRE